MPPHHTQGRRAGASSCSSAGCLIFVAIAALWLASFGYFLRARSLPPSAQLGQVDRQPLIESLVLHPRPLLGGGDQVAIQQMAVDPNPHPSSHQEGDDSAIHIVFSTDCSFFQDWQSLMVFHSAVQVKQKGEITRIASGCDVEKQGELKELYQKLYPQYRVHFTPDFKKDGKTKKKYDFYNKPYGLHHWLQHADPPVSSGTVVILIDPDMIILRPLTLQVAGYPTLLKLPNYGGSDVPPKFVGRGHAAAQIYGLGAPWTINNKNFNRTEVCGVGSPCLEVTQIEGEKYYSVGPPYLVERDDLLRLTNSWTKFVPKVYSRYPELLAEMFAYSMAAAHESLPHFTMRHYMVSNTLMDEEAWTYVDELKEEVCEAPTEPGQYYPGRPLPNILHYCQFFRIGELGFQKRRLRKKMFQCDGPLLAATPKTLGALRYKNRDGEIMKLGEKQARRNTFAICVLHRSINSMLTYYRERMCADPRSINYNETENLVGPGY